MIQETRDQEFFNELCLNIIKLESIQFVGIINKLGNMISGKFREDVKPFETEEKCRMLFIQMVLEVAMRKDLIPR